MKKFSMTTAVFMALLAGATVWAQDVDVEFGYDAGSIVLESGLLYDGDFADFEGGPDSTDEPGYESEAAEGLGIGPNELLQYNVAGPLVYHDGTNFAATAATLTVQDAVGPPHVDVTSSTFSGSGLIGQADDQGDFHSHIDYTISSGAPIGAYGLYLTLLTLDENLQPSGMADSPPFLIVFNRGLDEVAFETAVSAFHATIPEPSALALFGACGLGMGAGRWRFASRTTGR